MTENIRNLRDRIVEAARRWYRYSGHAESELAGLVQELEAELTQRPSPTSEGAP